MMRASPAGSSPSRGVSAHIIRGWTLMRARLTVVLSLGAAVVLSLVSVCCGIGVFTAPWFLCELSAVYLAEAFGRRVERSRTWFGAALVLVGAVLLTSSVAWLTLLGFGTDVPDAGPPVAASFGQLLSGSGVFAAAAGLGALVFVLPFLYVSHILIDVQGTLGGAVLESARLVSRDGIFWHLRLTLLAHSVQVAPAALVALWTASSSDGPSPLWALSCLPVLAITIPFGQAMISSAYIDRRANVVDPSLTRVAGRPTRAVVLLWVVLVFAPLASFGTLGAALLRPSRVQSGVLPPGAELLADEDLGRRPLSMTPPGTALRIMASTERADVAASDGGGAGRLPLPGRAALTRARVGRVRDSYGVELTGAGRSYLTWVDAAGVRLDDDLRARLADRLPLWALLGMLAGLLLTASALLPVMSGLAEVRRAYALPLGERPPADRLAALRSRALRRAWVAALVLLPVSAASLYWGLRALFG